MRPGRETRLADAVVAVLAAPAGFGKTLTILDTLPYEIWLNLELVPRRTET